MPPRHASSDSSWSHRKLFTKGGFKMSPNKLFLFAKSHSLFVNIFAIVLTIPILLLLGCKNNAAKGVKPEITLQNLQTAYSREMRISREYALFSENAEKNRFSAIASLFKAVSRSEEIHAEMAAALLRSKGVEVHPYVTDPIIVGTVMQTLRMALSDELLETESMYPNIERTAKGEKFIEAVESFGHSLNAGKCNAGLFRDAVDKSGYITKMQYYVCPCCGYIMTSDAAQECPECHEKKEKFEKI